MNRVFLLMAEFNTSEIPLADIAEKYLSLSTPQAKRKAAKQTLPFPVYKAGTGQKSQWLVHAQDLANYLEAQREAAAKEWKAINEAA